MAFESRNTIDEKLLRRLIALYQQAQKELLANYDNATDFSQARRRELLIQTETILKELGVKTGEWLEIAVADQYRRGIEDTIKQLSSLNVGINKTTTFSTIDKQAVAALLSETQEAFAMSLTTVGQSARRAVSAAVKEAIKQDLAMGRVKGSTRLETSRDIKARLKADGITALRDRSGREWKLDRYADMLARTKLVEARNTGLMNKMLANGYDLVQVSRHNSDHDKCRKWEGKIVSISGRSKKYPPLSAAIADGLLHPNCEHQINAIDPDDFKGLKVYDNPYNHLSKKEKAAARQRKR